VFFDLSGESFEVLATDAKLKATINEVKSKIAMALQ
jgi:hypothetical protein